MKCNLVTFSILAQTTMMVLLSSCDTENNSTATESNSAKDTGTSTPIGAVAPPVLSPPGGTYSVAQSVTISSTTIGATIYYTVDGSTPTTASTKYASPVNVSVSKTLKAIAMKPGMTMSTVFSAAYTINNGGYSSTIPWNTSITYGSVSDAAGQTYKTVKIGTQTWMAENLNLKVDSSWCYENSADSCAKYGRLYQWSAAMGLDASYNSKMWSVTLHHQGICPSGWRIPSNADWDALATYVGKPHTGGEIDSSHIKLGSISGWSYDEFRKSSGNGTDTYGFRILPAGTRLVDGSFLWVGNEGVFWSLTENDGDRSWHINPLDGYDNLNHYSLKKLGYSVRCIKD